MRHHVGNAFRHIDIAEEPDDAIEQQVLYRRIEIELHLFQEPCLSRPSIAVSSVGHPIAVAHRGEGRRQPAAGVSAGLACDAHDE